MPFRDDQDTLDRWMRWCDAARAPTRCAEYQADGVPCTGTIGDCDHCARALARMSCDPAPLERAHA